MANGKLTTGDRLMKLEVRLDDVCADLAEIKDSQRDLLKEMRRHCEIAEEKYATKSELSFVRKWLYVLSGSLITFLIWALEEYLKLK